MSDDSLRAKLTEDLGSSTAAEPMLSAAYLLSAWPAPSATPAQTARLIARLKPELPSPQSPISNLFSTWPFLLFRSQLQVVRSEIWAASALVMTLGTGVTLLMAGHPDGQTLPLVLIAPLVAAIGLAFLYGPAADPALEIEWTTPASPRLLLLARLALVFGFDLALAVSGSALLAVARVDLDFWPIVSAWLAPMAFLSAIAFLLAVLTSEPTLGTLAGLGLWGLLNAIRLAHLNNYAFFNRWPDLLAADAQPWLWGLAIVLGAFALWLGGREERWLQRPA